MGKCLHCVKKPYEIQHTNEFLPSIEKHYKKAQN